MYPSLLCETSCWPLKETCITKNVLDKMDKHQPWTLKNVKMYLQFRDKGSKFPNLWLLFCITKYSWTQVLPTQGQLLGVWPSFNLVKKKVSTATVTKCSIHGQITAWNHSTLFTKLYSLLWASEKRLPPFSSSSEPPACLTLCVSHEIWKPLLSPNQICWEQQLHLIESQLKFQFQRPAARVHGRAVRLQVWMWGRGLMKKGRKLIWHSSDK